MFFSKMTRIQKAVPALLLAAAAAGAQTHFSFTSTTGNNMTVIVQVSILPMVMGQPLAASDEIGVFTPAGLCVGARAWDGVSNRSITVWGDNDQTPGIDGARTGETLSYKVWDASLGQEYMVAATYDTIPPATSRGVYSANGIAILKSLGVLPLPSTPVLLSPADGAKGLSLSPMLVWNASPEAATYQLQVATDSLFSAIFFSDTTLTTTQKVVYLSGLVTCYWRVKAKNANGNSSWSAVWRFSTGMVANKASFGRSAFALPSKPAAAYTLSGRMVSGHRLHQFSSTPRSCMIERNGSRTGKKVINLNSSSLNQ